LKRFTVAFCLLAALTSVSVAQELPPDESLVPEEYNPEEFPMWTHDLRRFEVVSIGSFPITFFATSLAYDFSTYASHGWDPMYSMGTQRENRDIAIIMGTAAGLSLSIATIDMIINIRKRNRRDAEE
jgi:hypothetical protein